MYFKTQAKLYDKLLFKNQSTKVPFSDVSVLQKQQVINEKTLILHRI